MPMMIKASLVNPVKQWMPMDDARYWIECGMARYCGDNKHEDVHSNRGMPGRPGAPGRPGPRGEMGPPGESPYLQLERTTDGVRLIAINPQCEDPEVQEITLATPATIFKTMCDCWNQVFV